MGAEVRTDLVDFVISNYLFGDVARTPRNDESLIESGVVDSTGILELIEFLEDRFGIQVEDNETVPSNLGSIDNLVAFVETKRSALAGSR